MGRRRFTVLAVAALSLAVTVPAQAGVVQTAEVTIDPTGTFYSAGAIVTGTAVCSADTHPNGIAAVVSLHQTVGGQPLEGFVDTGLTCDGDTQPWGVLIEGNRVDNRGNSLWQAGSATARIFVDDPAGGPGQLVERTITLERTWSHVGTGPLATSTGTTATVSYPSGIIGGDLLLPGCQGKRNTMNWSASGFTTVPDPQSHRPDRRVFASSCSSPGRAEVNRVTHCP